MVPSTTVESGCGAALYPLSPMQQGMLFHRLQGAHPGVDVEQVIAELRHPVSAPEFEQAWGLVWRRHDALRSSFIWRDGTEPRQVVVSADETALPVRVLDLTGSGDTESIMEQYLAADRRAGFAQLSAPLARVALFQDGDRAWFVFTYHHLILDARGMIPLFRQVMDAHDALVRGGRAELPPVRPYRDYIAWLAGLDAKRADAFWREQLQGFEPVSLPLPAPAEPSAGSDHAPGELAMRFSAAETAQLRAAAQRHGVTLNTLLQGAWAIVLSRYCGQDDVAFGAVRACRHVPVEGAASLVGMLINTVPMRVRLAPAASVDHWLRGLREQWVALRDFEHASLMQVQRCCATAPGRALFDTLFNYQEPSWMAALGALGGEWTKRRFDIRSQPGYPLALDIYGDERLLVRAFYERRRFAADAIARLLRHYRAAVLALADRRADTLGDISLLDPAEREQVLFGFNATAADYAAGVCAHAFVAAQAAVAPERIAVSDARATLTYGELETRANQLAQRLARHAVGPDVPVAVCMKRSVEMVVAWVAVLKAGGAFVPLDPDYPAERLSFQVQDCGAPVLLTQPELASSLPKWPTKIVQLEVRADGAGFADETAEAPAETVTARNLAYIIYTSGSTGVPKGVAVEHRSLMNLVGWHQRAYAISAVDRATHLASPAFDASVWEIWPYLTCGASVHIPDDETRLAPAKLWAWMAEQKITVSFMPTPLAEAALAEPWPAGMALRALLTGGDQLRRGAPAGFPCALVNHYGPTESTVVATAARVPTGAVGAPPIGRPIANIQAYVLDRQLRPVAIGLPGELYLGGDSLARGYHLRSELTAERFVAYPAAPQCHGVRDQGPGASSAGAQAQCDLISDIPAGTRLYRTGDLVRWRADGQLEFLGRIDNQVKIRGHRIELGEIENALQKHARVREAVVVARADERGVAQLVAYVIPAGSPAPQESELKESLSATLPAYMVPAAVVTVESWPLTPNGKIDRKALPAPAAKATAQTAQFAAPRTAEEQQIAQIWADVLGRAEIGLHDDFFDLGGHSLLAAQAITRLNAALGASISVRMLFDHPTLAEFSAELARRGASAPRPAIRPKRRPSTPELELVQPR